MKNDKFVKKKITTRKKVDLELALRELKSTPNLEVDSRLMDKHKKEKMRNEIHNL